MQLRLKNLVVSRRAYSVFVISVRVITVYQIGYLTLSFAYRDESRNIALQYAAYCDTPEYLSPYLDTMTGIDFRNNEGMTPLMLASKNGRRKNVIYLLEQGADKTNHNDNGKTAYDLALEGMRQENPHTKGYEDYKTGSNEDYKQILALTKP